MANQPLFAVADGINTWEKYDVISAGNGLVAHRANMNGGYVAPTAPLNDPAAPLRATGGTVLTNGNRFGWINNYDGTISLQRTTNGKFATVDLSEPNFPIEASATGIQSGQKFTVQSVP